MMHKEESQYVAQRVREAPLVGSRVYEDAIIHRKAVKKDIVQLGVRPVRELPPHVIEAAQKACAHPNYVHSRGLPELRQALADMVSKEIQKPVDWETQVLITNGAMQGQWLVMSTLLDIGSEVIIPSPCFFFHPMVRIIGGVPVLVPLRKDSLGYHFDMDRIEGAITPKTRYIILNTPQNPTGCMATQNDLERLAEISQKYNLVIAADESYERMIYDGRLHRMFAALPGVDERSVLVRSFTKTFAMPEWRMGYLVGPADIIAGCHNVIQLMNLTCNHVCQWAAWAAVSGPPEWLNGVDREFQANRDSLYEAISEIPNIFSFAPEGGPFAWIDTSRLVMTDDQLCDMLLDNYGIVAAAGHYFDAPTHIRIPFGGIPPEIDKLKERLFEAISKSPRK
jgi:aspartate/methionine/tyrosine aminotransferase